MSIPRVRTASLPAIAFFGVLFLFFFQLLTDFVQAVYHFGLLGTGIPFELLTILLMFTPVALIFLRSDPPAILAFILAKLVLMSRVIEVLLLDPRGSMIVSGIGVGCFLLLLPLILWDLGRKQDRQAIAEMGVGLILGLVVTLLFRTLGSGQDISTIGWWQLIGWALAILAGAASVYLSMVEEYKPDVPEPLFMPSVNKRRLKLVGLSIGLMAVIVLLSFVFISPQAITTWSALDYGVILTVMMVTLTVWTWIVLMRQEILSRITPAIVLVWNALFVVALALTAYVFQIAFPSAPPPSWSYHIPLLLALVLFPIILLDFGLLADEIVTDFPSVKGMGIAFSLASLFLLATIFAYVFAYANEPILIAGSLFQDKFWLLNLIAGIILLLAMLLAFRRIDELPKVSMALQNANMILTGSVAGASAFAVVAAILFALFK